MKSRFDTAGDVLKLIGSLKMKSGARATYIYDPRLYRPKEQLIRIVCFADAFVVVNHPLQFDTREVSRELNSGAVTC